MTAPLHVNFDAGPEGAWRITEVVAVAGEGLAVADRLSVTEAGPAAQPSPCTWRLRGFTSNIRYTRGAEAASLRRAQAGLGRGEATRAALIPIRKSAAWWALAQDERRAVFEEQSRHIGIGLAHLPAIARRLHHSRDLGEPFDFLTWFEFAPEHEAAFDAMLEKLRATPEWAYVEREVDVRVSRARWP